MPDLFPAFLFPGSSWKKILVSPLNTLADNYFFYLGGIMARKFILSIVLLLLLVNLSSCYMHTVGGMPHHWHPSGRTHRHWGISRNTGVHHNFWGKHRYGPKPNRHRGHYRQ